jgi:hypothetical protein
VNVTLPEDYLKTQIPNVNFVVTHVPLVKVKNITVSLVPMEPDLVPHLVNVSKDTIKS